MKLHLVGNYLFSVLIFSVEIFSQQIHFRHLTIDNGLSQNAVSAILQDKQGFMWFGTKDGLNRYDGYKFKIFQNDPSDTTSISSNYISSLHEDRSGIIWIGTLTGDVNYYQPANGIFTKVNLLNNINRITTFAEDNSGSLWIGTEGNGIFRLMRNNQVHHFTSQYLSIPTALSSNNISIIYSDLNGKIWIGNSSGLDLFNPEDNSFKHYELKTTNPDAPSFPAENAVTAIIQTDVNSLWLGTPTGLVNFQIDSGMYKVYPHHYNIFRFGWGTIIDIKKDQSGNLWLASPAELMEFNLKSKTYRYFTNDPLDPKSISYNAVSSLWCDNSGILWVGTPGAGIKYL